MLCKVINTNKRQLEEETNQWLASGKYEIVKVIQTEDSNMGYITLTIFYLDLKEIRKKKIQKIGNT